MGGGCQRLFPRLYDEDHFGEAEQTLVRAARLLQRGLLSSFPMPVDPCYVVSDFPLTIYGFKHTHCYGMFHGRNTSCKGYPSGGRACFNCGMRTLVALRNCVATFRVAPTSASSHRKLQSLISGYSGFAILTSGNCINRELVRRVRRRGVYLFTLGHSGDGRG